MTEEPELTVAEKLEIAVVYALLARHHQGTPPRPLYRAQDEQNRSGR